MRAGIVPGPAPVKCDTASRAVAPFLEVPVADSPNWTIARLRAGSEAGEGVRISGSQSPKALLGSVDHVTRQLIPAAPWADWYARGVGGAAA
ncbi:MAG TPA: hypothetical protein DDZ81_22035, partial [Acetobacteraceae bacterium]|nr:hypothetical protein [Acetobacteraceae bacterium]